MKSHLVQKMKKAAYILICSSFLFACMATWGFSLGLCAEKENTDQIYQLEEVRVSAGKMETTIDKIPTNIDIITREDIEKTPGIVYLNDLVQRIPGLYAPRFQSGVANDGVFSMRGSELNSQGLRVLVNGIEFNKGNGYVVLPRIPLHDVERIEIIKTASAEYGDQASGGVINIVTRISSERIEAKVGGAIVVFNIEPPIRL
nr:TonB-dependent receptor plug domain-containing protein [Desulfobacula sp.]